MEIIGEIPNGACKKAIIANAAATVAVKWPVAFRKGFPPML
jgi:hypothetical protein